MPAIGHDEVLVEEKANSTDQGGVLHQVGKWYTGGHRFSLPGADQKVLIEEDISSTEQKEVAHWKGVRSNSTEQYTESSGFSLQTTDLKRAFDKTENQEKDFSATGFNEACLHHYRSSRNFHENSSCNNGRN